MGLFAFRRLRDAEALAQAGASFSVAEPEPKLEVIEEPPKPKRSKRTKTTAEPLNGDHD